MGGQHHNLDNGFGEISEVIWFLPGNHPNPFCNAGTYKNIPELEYHKRWDWLMPVVKKIKNLKPITGNMLQMTNQWEAVEDALTTIKIEKIWLSVTEFIKWYKSQP